MKKLLILVALQFTAFLFLFSIAPVDARAHAVSTDAQQVVRLNDGSPIPYFDGFQSSILENKDVITGVTGMVNGTYSERVWVQEGNEGAEATNTYTLQNLALTDDVLALFFLTELERPFRSEAGDMQYSQNQAVSIPTLFVDGEHLDWVDGMFLREAHLLDEKTLSCMAVISLAQPLQEGQVLTIAPEFDESLNQFVGGIAVTIDKNSAQDPTVAYQPTQEETLTFANVQGEKNVKYRFVVERVAFTPFGNRLLVNYEDTGRNTAYMHLQIADETGTILPLFSSTSTSNSKASVEHPQWMRNEVWFLRGESAKQLSMIPIQYIDVKDHSKTMRTAYVPVDSLPCRIELENGGALDVNKMDLSKDGFLIDYLPIGYTDSLEFDLADTNQRPLGFNFVTIQMADIVRHQLQEGGYWSEEYKDRIVSRVTEEDIAKVGAIAITYRVKESILLFENAVTVGLR